MGAVAVECLDVHEDGAFDFGVVGGVGKGCGEVGVILDGHDAGMTVDFQPPAMGVIHGKQCDAVICAEVALARLWTDWGGRWMQPR